ncbi:hypothetical protein Golob_002537 [Gossypium lobatum]|uniref:Uncharacterized protein n=1 Tax=Gossypium lobatum TaxID=34289 RepID=A0A7J8N5F3_9ROSI|nr:hypothetical protein [Gossypium lobatum]
MAALGRNDPVGLKIYDYPPKQVTLGVIQERFGEHTTADAKDVIEGDEQDKDDIELAIKPSA